MARLFFAIEIPADIRARMAELAGVLRATGARASWVPVENIHYTLKFLGEIPEPRTGDLEREAERASRGVTPFSIRVGGTGAFPSPTRPRIVWVGGTAAAGAAENLGRIFDEVGAGCGVAREDRPFRLHATLARLRRESRPPHALVEALREHAHDGLGDFECRAITLFESKLGAGPPRYHARATLPLA